MSSYLGQSWTSPVYPQETNISSPQCPTDHWSRRPIWAWEASFGCTQAGGYLPAGVTMSSYASWYHPNQPFTLSNPGIRNSHGSQYLYCPAFWDSSWDRLRCPLWQSILNTRGDEQGHGATTYNEGIHRCPWQKAGIGHQNYPLSKQGPNCQSHEGGEGPFHNCNSKCWGYVHSSYQGGTGHLCGLHLHPKQSHRESMQDTEEANEEKGGIANLS